MGKQNWFNVVKVAGAYISFCIGSAFATGQELVQYFCSFGIWGYLGIIVSMLLHVYMAYSFLTLGFRKQFHNSMEVFEYYCGPKLGRAFQWLAISFLFLSPTVMISGFGATLSQYYNTPVIVGSLIMGALCLLTVLAGLKRLVDIVGTVGPVIIVITLVIGVYAIITNLDGLAAGIAVAPSIEVPQVSQFWFVSGFLDASWAPLIIAPFLVAVATTVNYEKEAIRGGLLGIVFYGLAGATMVTAFFCQYAEVSANLVPTLYLVTNISKSLSIVFMIVVFLGIYSSAVPSMFNFCAAFFQEKTKGYYIFAIASITFATLGSMVLPFDLLMNRVYAFYGYASIAFLIMMVVKQIRIRAEKKPVDTGEDA